MNLEQMKRELTIKFEEETEEERRARLAIKLTPKEKCEAILGTIEWKLREVEEDIRKRADPKKIIGYHLSPTMILLDLAKKECLANPKFWVVVHDGTHDRHYIKEDALDHAKELEEKYAPAIRVRVFEYTPDPTEPTGYKFEKIYPRT